MTCSAEEHFPPPNRDCPPPGHAAQTEAHTPAGIYPDMCPGAQKLWKQQIWGRVFKIFFGWGGHNLVI